MNVAGFIFRPLYWVAGKVFATWARPAVQPDDPSNYLSGDDAEVCYVLETGGLADTLALERACKIHGMPWPTSGISYGGIRESRRMFVMKPTSGLIFRRKRITDFVHGFLDRFVDFILVEVRPTRKRLVRKLLMTTTRRWTRHARSRTN